MYWEIIIFDETGLSGISVAEMIKELLKVVACSRIHVYEFEGIADQSAWEKVLESGHLKTNEFIDLIRDAIQVEWATFCLLKDSNTNSHSQTYFESYLECIRDSDVVVRCADGTDFFIYTKNNDLSTTIQTKYSCLSATQIDLMDVRWPG
ncbi:hypothetical protein [Leeia aquatica]|uniref:Uncharacterized protein n=1 Tax=Leeia aquatica TaxID=2725557 RepID=A0A847S759_9NEIS|nr:hypothetical protein [Leeia aquatica]NLR75754.1 hypothetical protein [Leeia aquatica]